MSLYSILSLGCYTRPESYEQVSSDLWLVWYFSGLQTQQIYAPDGRLLASDGPETAPYQALYPAGIRTRFRFGAGRENWVMMLSSEAFVHDEEHGEFRMRNGDGEWIGLKPRRELSPEETVATRERLRRIRHLLESALPCDHAAANLLAGDFFGAMLETPAGQEFPEERLRARIDADQHWRNSLADISLGLGLGRDQLRRRFLERYGLTPGAYRDQRRFHQAMHRLMHTDLSLKEIADQLGMNHVTHLYALFKRHTELSPSEIQRRYRREKW